MIKKIFPALLAATTFLTACSSSPVSVQNLRPAWIEHPGEGVVGISAVHIKGSHAQRKLAAARARTELASRMGVSVENILMIQEREHNDSATTTAQQDTKITTSRKSIKARIVETWLDPYSREVYVYMVKE